MLNKVLQAIVYNLDDEFGLDIYTDEIEQLDDEFDDAKQQLENDKFDVAKPFFTVTSITNTENQLLSERYQRNYSFMVQYIAESKDCSAECNEVIERLMNCLELVVIDGELVRRDADVSARIIDGVLNFEVSYRLHIFKHIIDDSEIMEHLAQDSMLKE